MNAVLVEVIADHAVFDHHLAVGVKFIFARRHRRAVRIRETADKLLSQIDRLALRDLVAVVDEIEITIEFHKLIRFQLNAVLVEIIADHAVFNHHLAVGVKLVISRFERRAVRIRETVDKLLRQIDRLALRDLVAVVDEIEITIKFYQLIRIQARAVLVEIVADHAVFDHHLAVRVKLVISRFERRAVRIRKAVHISIAQVYRFVFGDLMRIADKVQRTVVLDKTICFHLLVAFVEVLTFDVQRIQHKIRNAVVDRVLQRHRIRIHPQCEVRTTVKC